MMLFQPEPCVGASPEAAAPSAQCLARWEDDGGRIAPAEAGRGRADGPNVRSEHEIGSGPVAVPVTVAEANLAAWRDSGAVRPEGVWVAGFRDAADGAWPSPRAAGSTETGGDIGTRGGRSCRGAEAPSAHI